MVRVAAALNAADVSDADKKILLLPLGTELAGLSTETDDAEDRVGVAVDSFPALVPDISNQRRCSGNEAGSVLVSSTTIGDSPAGAAE
jgi:hypothetical protein